MNKFEEFSLFLLSTYKNVKSINFLIKIFQDHKKIIQRNQQVNKQGWLNWQHAGLCAKRSEFKPRLGQIRVVVSMEFSPMLKRVPLGCTLRRKTIQSCMHLHMHGLSDILIEAIWSYPKSILFLWNLNLVPVIFKHQLYLFIF